MTTRRAGRRSAGRGAVSELYTQPTVVAPSHNNPPTETGRDLPEGMERALLSKTSPAYVADLTGILLFANPAYRELLRNADAAGERDTDDAAASLLSLEALDLVQRQRGPVELDESFTIGDTTRHFRSHHFPLTDESGALIGVGGVYREITRERQLSEKAGQIQERFDDITRLVSDWVWEVDRDFNFTYVSARVMEVFGMHPRLLVGSNLFDLGEFAAPADDEIDRTCRSPFRDKVFRVTGAERRTRLCHLSGMPIFESASGAFIGFRGTGNDITARLEAEERAARAQTRLSEAIESSSEAFALFDRNDRLVICNGKFREYLPTIADLMAPGVRYEELIRAGAERGQFADAVGAVDTWIASELERRHNPQGAYEQRLSDGRWLQVSDRRAKDGSMVCLRTDITDLKHREDVLRRAEETSRAAREAAEVANRAKSEFLATVSHELRTPLNAIIGFSEIIMAEMFGPIESQQYKDYIRDIHESGSHLYSLINDILDVSKVEAGKLELLEDDVDVADLVARSVRMINERAERAGVTLKVEAPENLPGLRADERKLKQILLNLLSNAVKFTPSGGTVTTTVSIDGDGWFRLAVTDTGIGIDNKDMNEVMTPFGQVDSTLSRKYEGTGLGLPLTKAMVELHEGVLDLKSEVDVGTTVTVRLPPERVLAD